MITNLKQVLGMTVFHKYLSYQPKASVFKPNIFHEHQIGKPPKPYLIHKKFLE